MITFRGRVKVKKGKSNIAGITGDLTLGSSVFRFL